MDYYLNAIRRVNECTDLQSYAQILSDMQEYQRALSSGEKTAIENDLRCSQIAEQLKATCRAKTNSFKDS